MKSLTNKTTNSEFIGRINNLSQESQPQWGKMSVDQMLAHCAVGMRISFGEVKTSSNIFMKLIGKIIKKKVFAQEQFRKNSPTGKEFLIKDKRNFFAEQAGLIYHLKRCAEKGNAIFSKEPHPFFGKLTPEEWDNLTYKHIDHHLRQFNV
jgi:hypothetical protein